MSRIWIRADGGPGIGAGHLMRCLSVARAAEALGARARFIVSGPESAALVAPSGVEVAQVGGDPFALGRDDAERVLELAGPGDAVLVDSYGVSEGFFGALAGRGITVVCIDDRYLFSEGPVARPRRWGVDVLVDYGFGAGACGYGEAYAGGATRLLLGPAYAPVRRGFRGARARRDAAAARRVLVTCGSTNPGRALERMAEGCLAACEMPLDVVVGALAEFDEGAFPSERVSVHRGVRDLAPLMERAALAVSAAGSTLYELSCAGVPTVACPIVENQLANAAGFSATGLGIAIDPGWTADDVKDAAASLDGDPAADGFHEAMLSAVDGRGSQRIAEVLLLKGTTRGDVRC